MVSQGWVEKRLPDTLFTPVAAHLPDDALGPESAIEFRVDTFAAILAVQALAALPAKTRSVLSTHCHCFTIPMILALHLFPSLVQRIAYPGAFPIRRKPP